LLFEYGCTLLYAFLTAIEPNGVKGCTVRVGCLTGVVGTQFLASAVWQPYTRPFTNFFMGGIYFIETIALVMLSAQTSLETRSEQVQKGSVALIIFTTAIQMLAGILYLIVLLTRYFSKRSSTTKRRKQARYEAENALVVPLAEIDEPESKRETSNDPLLGERSGNALVTAGLRERQVVDDSDEEVLDPEADKILDAIERARKPVGVFRGDLRRGTVGAAFSPSRRLELQRRQQLQREILATESKRVARPELEGSQETRVRDSGRLRTPWLETIDVAESDGDEETSPKCRFVSEDIDPTNL